MMCVCVCVFDGGVRGEGRVKFDEALAKSRQAT